MEKMKYLLITWNDAWCNDDQLIPEEEPKTEPLETIDIGIVFKESEEGILLVRSIISGIKEKELSLKHLVFIPFSAIKFKIELKEA